MLILGQINQVEVEVVELIILQTLLEEEQVIPLPLVHLKEIKEAVLHLLEVQVQLVHQEEEVEALQRLELML